MNTRIALLFSFLCLTLNIFSQEATVTKTSKNADSSLKSQRLSDQVNSGSSDLASLRYRDRIYFTSMRQQPGDEAPVSRIYSFTPGNKPVEETELNFKKKTSHIGSMTLTPDAQRIYFSVCRDSDPEKCELWYRDREYEGTWSISKKLPDFINLRGYTTMQPAIGWDASLKQYVLYFVSDRPGGKGKKDIWCSPVTWDGNFETPFALDVNTPQDEVTPFFYQPSQTLFFSSNGYKGLGNFDIYKAEKTGNESWSKAENMGRPFNSGYDDLYFTWHESSQSAYLASDRPGSLCDSKTGEGQCFDLYEIPAAGKVFIAKAPEEGTVTARK